MVGENPSTFLRLFIALALPSEVREEIGRAQKQLQRVAPPGIIRWTRPAEFHVTLKFLGDVPAGQVEALEQSVARVCSRGPALQLSARGVGFFPGVQNPRVIWAGADDGDGKLRDLHQQIDAAVRLFGSVGKPEKFTGHITVGRFKPGRHVNTEALLKRATMLRDRPFGDWRAGKVEIIRSELTSVGAQHTALASLRLAG
jgi:RNA 2',3'-cyclic 3'-phosphodiesterase